MPCNAIAMTTATLRANARLLLADEYREALKNTVRAAVGLNAYQVTAYRYDGRLWVQAGPAQLTISDNGTVEITIYQSRITAAEAARLRDRITAALAALEQVLTQAHTARTIAGLLAVEKTQVDAAGNIALTVSL
jgi:hypothetical protein